MDIVADFQPERTDDPPPFGHISTKHLVSYLLAAERADRFRLPLWFQIHGATLDVVRRELRRREQLGVGVR